MCAAASDGFPRKDGSGLKEGQRCDCGPQRREAAERITGAGGFLLYLRQEGRSTGLQAELDAYALQDAGLDTYEANTALGRGEDERDNTAAAQMLRAVRPRIRKC